ncbi:MAG: hypothetical protein PHN49_11000 [Candidatus Omnitrophica bacterium]|nr:hypothetical protein [Candidatus Omnitrophota bacterium]MDD5672156.1 hypothetical protein [Candidatus Omnitrophota bacterium]
MKIRMCGWVLLVLSLSVSQLAMARHGIYDEEAREAERIAKQNRTSESEPHHPLKGIASGVKEATVDSTEGLLVDTAEGSTSGNPVTGTLEGARKGTGQVLDKTVKGAYKVATLGFGDLKSYEVEPPESESGDTTKIKIKIPGT